MGFLCSSSNFGAAIKLQIMVKTSQRERERAHGPEPILKASEREKEHGRGPDYGPEASERKPGREDGSVCPSPCQKHQKERGSGAVIAPAPDWKHQRGSAAAVVAA